MLERHSWTSPSGVWHKDAPFAGLAVAPVVYLGVVALAGVFYELDKWLNDPREDWSDNALFKARARQLHTYLLRIQCAVGGASNADIRAVDGQLLCSKGTQSKCKVPPALKTDWADFINEFGRLWRNAEARTFGPSSTDAQLLRSAVGRARDFAKKFQSYCPKDVVSEDGPVEEPPPPPESGTPWELILGVAGGVALMVMLLRTQAAPIIVQTSRTGLRG